MATQTTKLLYRDGIFIDIVIHIAEIRQIRCRNKKGDVSCDTSPSIVFRSVIC